MAKIFAEHLDKKKEVFVQYVVGGLQSSNKKGKNYLPLEETLFPFPESKNTEKNGKSEVKKCNFGEKWGDLLVSTPGRLVELIEMNQQKIAARAQKNKSSISFAFSLEFNCFYSKLIVR